MRLPRNDWYACTSSGFTRVGQCTLEIERSQARRMLGEQDFILFTAYQLPQLKSRVDAVMSYHEDLEEEHTECMRHDAETGMDDDDDLEDDVHEESEDDDE